MSEANQLRNNQSISKNAYAKRTSIQNKFEKG
jgi:hypothetical protein